MEKILKDTIPEISNIDLLNAIVDLKYHQPNKKEEKLEKISVPMEDVYTLPFTKLGKEYIFFNNNEEKNQFDDLIKQQKETQRILSNLTIASEAFYDCKNTLKILGKKIQYYKDRPRPINSIYLKETMDKKMPNMSFVLERNFIDPETKLFDSATFYKICLLVCKENKEDAGDLYDLLTKTYDYDINNRAIIKIKTKDGQIYVVRLLNSDKYNNEELKIIKEKIFYDYNHFEYEEIKNAILLKQNQKYTEMTNETNTMCLDPIKKIKIANRWQKVKMFFQKQLFTIKLKNFLTKITKPILKKVENIKRNINKFNFIEKIKELKNTTREKISTPLFQTILFKNKIIKKMSVEEDNFFRNLSDLFCKTKEEKHLFFKRNYPLYSTLNEYHEYMSLLEKYENKTLLNEDLKKYSIRTIDFFEFKHNICFKKMFSKKQSKENNEILKHKEIKKEINIIVNELINNVVEEKIKQKIKKEELKKENNLIFETNKGKINEQILKLKETFGRNLDLSDIETKEKIEKEKREEYLRLQNYTFNLNLEDLEKFL